MARDLTNFCVVSLSSTAPVKTLRGFPTHGLAKGKARHLPFTATPGIARHSHTWLIERLSHAPNKDDELRGYPLSQQERRVPCSLISARSGVQLTTRAYSPVWFGLSACRGVVGGRVGSGFDKFLCDLPEFDGTWQDPARLPHSRLGQKNARHLHYGNTWHCAASHTLLIVRLSHNPKRDDEVRGYLHSRQERRVPCSLISARSGVYLTTRACSLWWFGGGGTGGPGLAGWLGI